MSCQTLVFSCCQREQGLFETSQWRTRYARADLPDTRQAVSDAGVDVRYVVQTGITPAINTGIAHRLAGVGQIGAGVSRAPLACFEQALLALAATQN